MNECKKLLNKYSKLQKINQNLLSIYNSFSKKGLCREDALIQGIDITKKIRIMRKKSENYYNKLKIHIELCIDVINKRNKYLLDAISRST
jgi:hypothetical protein